MSCPLLEDSNPAVCSAFDRSYRPSVFQVDEYCGRDRHRLCPFYCSVSTDGRFVFSRETIKCSQDTLHERTDPHRR